MNKYFAEKLVKMTLFFLASISIIISALIFLFLLKETLPFFQKVSVFEFLTSTVWSPNSTPAQFGVIPLVVGTFMIVIVSIIVAIPLGLGSAIFLSEYASRRSRSILKPILEILAGIPSVVYGFFAINFISPIIQKIVPGTPLTNNLVAGIAVGIMITPLIASMSEDALGAVPKRMAEASFGLGATKFETTVKVLIPSAISGIVASFILAISRAIGETMIVTIAAGSSNTLSFNPLNSLQTMTGYIANTSRGEAAVGSLGFQTLFAVALLLFFFTFMFNLIAKRITKKYRLRYN